ncbi:site-specific integrase [Microbacterium sp. ER1]|uniref:site-specific integrase n=1 Tax=Microbacterium sp. ER1 TaxID=1932846 RepID=UPI00201A9DF6|nr:site-specific integrase [Microbacterium sp. ER1]
MNPIQLLPDSSPLVSDYWRDGQQVLLNHRTQEAYAIPVFGNDSRWDLHALGWNPASGRHSAVLLFDALPGAWNLIARDLAMAMLNPGHQVLRDQSLYLSATPVHVKTIRSRLEGLKKYATWHAESLGQLPLHQLQQSHLDRFLSETKPVAAKSTLSTALAAVRDLHRYERVITGGGIPFQPWGDATTTALSGKKVGAELSTPVIPPVVWWPLLRACWQYIDVFSHDIFAAADEWSALDRPVEDRTRVDDPDGALARWMDEASSSVPLHRLTYGRFQRGEIHWTLLALLVTGGHSRNMFAEVTSPAVMRRRNKVTQAIATGALRTTPGGLLTTAAEVARADGSVGPWIDGFDPATIRSQLKILRNACYVFCAALTMMRDSELLSIRKGALTTFYGAPAVTSQLRKGRRGTRKRNWWIIEPVAQAISVAERLTASDAVFGSSRLNHQKEGQLVTFDRHDELKKFIVQLNALGPDAGLEPIPDFHLAPHMFRRTMAVVTAQQPDGEIALGIQLKHAARRAVANGTTSGYASETPEWAAEFEHELQEAVASRLVGMWSSGSADDIRLAGAGAQRFRSELTHVEEEASAAVRIGDERILRTLLRDRFSTLRWGTINHCLGDPEQAACLKGLPAEAAAGGVMPNRCVPTACGNSVVTDEHAPVWIAEERDLVAKLRDRRIAPHNREQLEAELQDVRKITKRFTDA